MTRLLSPRKDIWTTDNPASPSKVPLKVLPMVVLEKMHQLTFLRGYPPRYEQIQAAHSHGKGAPRYGILAISKDEERRRSDRRPSRAKAGKSRGRQHDGLRPCRWTENPTRRLSGNKAEVLRSSCHDRAPRLPWKSGPRPGQAGDGEIPFPIRYPKTDRCPSQPYRTDRWQFHLDFEICFVGRREPIEESTTGHSIHLRAGSVSRETSQ